MVVFHSVVFLQSNKLGLFARALGRKEKQLREKDEEIARLKAKLAAAGLDD
eukprot:m.172697 g.172697  ORF g.172697 m.172697 type:complete len:51 (-) comp21285_c0_seq3:78-230(-)